MEEYIKIPNEILEALARTRLSNYEFRYIWVLLRKTWGWNKPSDYIANSQFVQATGVKKWSISKIQKRLIWRKIVAKRGNKLSFNTNYGEWKELPIGTTVANLGQKVANRDNKVANLDGHKRHSPNDTKQTTSYSLNQYLENKEKGRRIIKKPYFLGDPIVWSSIKRKWFVVDGYGEWREWAGEEKEIEWK